MKAIFVTGGKQYHVSEGDVLYVEKLPNEAGSEVKFSEVLYVDGKIGTPYVKNASVTCTVEKHGKNKKITVFKYIPQKKYSNKIVHIQPYTKLVVIKIES